MLRSKYDYDIVIIGGGAAGVHAAFLLAGEGKRVALCEQGTLGGYEAVEGYGERAPLVAGARLLSAIKASSEIGIRGGSVGYNYPTIREWSRSQAVKARSAAAYKSRLESVGVDVHAATARFIGPHEISLGRRRITGAQFLVTTGSTPVVPSTIAGLTAVRYLTPQSALDLLKPPKSLFIIGGGKTGVEFASLFSSFGSAVSIAEIAPRLLPDEDVGAGEALKRELEARGSSVLTSARITSVTKEGTTHRITYLRGDVEHVVKAEAVLLAAGRAPSVHFGLENAEVEYSPLGIAVNAALQTSARHVYAAGSVTGNVRSAEGAVLEADYAAANLLRREKLPISYTAVPTVIYAQPEVARVGVNEGEALRKDIAVRSATASLSDTLLGRASRDTGSVTLIANKKGILVGATVIGRGAADSINALTVAVEGGMAIEKLARLPFATGSASQAITDAARALLADRD